MQVWGRSLEFWDSVTVWLMWIAAICGGTAAATGLAGAIISRQVSATTQRDADERISATNAVAAKAKLDLEQLRTQVAPRLFIRPAFLDALRGEPAGNVEIVFLRNDPECFDVAL